MMNSIRAILVGLGALLWIGGAVQAQARYSAQLADGTYLSRVELSDWNENAPPRFMTRRANGPPQVIAAMFDPRNPARWVRFDGVEPAPAPQSFVEMFGGDRMPGRPLGFEYGNESPTFSRPPHLLLKPDWPVAPGEELRPVRIDVRDIRRLVVRWRGSARYTPGVVYLDDGRQIAYRQIRWTSAGIRLLMGDGSTQQFTLDQIAELHLPRRDPWDAYLGTLARIDPGCDAPLIRVTTAAGLVATASLPLFRPGGDQQIVQPAWSSDPIWIPRRLIRQWTLFAPSQVPLSMIEPLSVTQRSALRGAYRMQTDRSAAGGDLRSGGRTWGWGLGMQAYNEARYELPGFARAFQSRVALDSQVARGGCARALVYSGPSSQPLWQSPPLVGSEPLVDTGAVTLPAAAGADPRVLVLVADPAEQDPPAGADPLNIRDLVNWLEPVIDLDPAALALRVKQVTPQLAVPAWAGWQLGSGREMRMTPRWDNDLRRFTDEMRVVGGNLMLSRKIHVAATRRYLSLTAFRYGGTQPGTIEVRIDGKPAGRFDVPERSGAWLPPARLVSLSDFTGRDVTLDIEQFGPHDAERGSVVWCGIGFVENPELAEPLQMLQARAAAEVTEIQIEPDGSIFARTAPKKSNPQSDSYTIRARTDLTGITGFRLELLTDDRLPGHGPGRQDGRVMLSEFSVTAAPLASPEKAAGVPLVAAAATWATDHHPPTAAIDSVVNNAWEVHGSHPQAAVFMADHPIGFPGGTLLTFKLGNRPHGGHHAGRFRISAIRGPMPSPVPLPAMLLPHESDTGPRKGSG